METPYSEVVQHFQNKCSKEGHYIDVLIHVVEKAEILGTIVKRYTDVTVEDIVGKNKLKDENSIYIGQKLIIPTEKIKELTTTQEVKDKLDKVPTKSTPIVATASAVSLPEKEEVESEEVKLTVKPKIVKVYFGKPVKSTTVKPSTQIETYTFRSSTGNVFVSYKKRKKNRTTGKYFYKYFYKKLRGFYVPDTFNICNNKELKDYTSTKEANKTLLSINIKENSDGESSR